VPGSIRLPNPVHQLPECCLKRNRGNLLRDTTMLVLFWWLSTFASVRQTATVKPPTDRVEVQYRFLDDSITLGEPAVILFSVHNGLSQPVTLTLGAGATQFFQFSVKTPHGRVLQNSRNPGANVSVVVFGTGKTTIEPGADYQQRIVMNQWFNFNIPGEYTLTSQLSTDIELADGEDLPPPNRITELRVRPRDPLRIEKMCQELLTQVENATTVDAEREPALELSYIVDPIAVPYIARLLSEHRLNYHLAVPGLERIGNDAAIEALIAATNDSYGDMAELARRALTRIEPRISNPNLRETVQHVLATPAGK